MLLLLGLRVVLLVGGRFFLWCLLFFLLFIPFLVSGLVMKNGTLLRYGNSSFNVTYNFTTNITFADNVSVNSTSFFVMFDELDNISLKNDNLSIKIISWENATHEFWLTGEDNNVTVFVRKNGWIAVVNYSNSLLSTTSFIASSSEANFSYFTRPVVTVRDRDNTEDLTPLINFSVVDCCNVTLSCTVFVNGVNVSSNGSTHNNTVTLINTSILSEGNKDFFVNCSNGQVGGVGKSPVENFFVLGSGSTGTSGGGSGFFPEMSALPVVNDSSNGSIINFSFYPDSVLLGTEVYALADFVRGDGVLVSKVGGELGVFFVVKNVRDSYVLGDDVVLDLFVFSGGGGVFKPESVVLDVLDVGGTSVVRSFVFESDELGFYHLVFDSSLLEADLYNFDFVVGLGSPSLRVSKRVRFLELPVFVESLFLSDGRLVWWKVFLGVVVVVVVVGLVVLFVTRFSRRGGSPPRGRVVSDTEENL